MILRQRQAAGAQSGEEKEALQAHALSAGGRRTHISHAHQTGPCLASGDCCSVNSNATRAMSMSLAITRHTDTHELFYYMYLNTSVTYSPDSSSLGPGV